MEQVILNGATVGVIVTLLCTASITSFLRGYRLTKVLDCHYCTSFWIAIAIDPSSTYFATVLFANVAIMLVHWSMATYQEQEGQT